MEVEVILLIEYPNLVSALENANYQISTEIKNILTKGNVDRYDLYENDLYENRELKM